ncbi:MAG: T9SS type A sorting domain-containing protein, partial [Bacteroidota bacterium]
LIYPNPSEGNFIIRVGTIKDSLDSINLIIYNHSGKEIFRKFFLKNEKESEIKLANIPVGVYFITLSSLNSSMSRKIVVY